MGGVILPTGYYFGVSAATGDLSDAHDLISMKLYDISTPDDVSILDFLYERDSRMSFVAAVFIFVVVVVGCR